MSRLASFRYPQFVATDMRSIDNDDHPTTPLNPEHPQTPTHHHPFQAELPKAMLERCASCRSSMVTVLGAELVAVQEAWSLLHRHGRLQRHAQCSAERASQPRPSLQRRSVNPLCTTWFIVKVAASSKFYADVQIISNVADAIIF